MANFRTFVKCPKCTGISKIFGHSFLRKFRVFIKTIKTVNGTQYPSCYHCCCCNNICLFIQAFSSSRLPSGQGQGCHSFDCLNGRIRHTYLILKLFPNSFIFLDFFFETDAGQFGFLVFFESGDPVQWWRSNWRKVSDKWNSQKHFWSKFLRFQSKFLKF